MATSGSSNSVAISQMTPLPVVNPAAVVPVVVGVNNYKATVGAINALNTKATIGLPDVDNISAANMPVSEPQRVALEQKFDKTGILPVAQVDGLDELLAGKLDVTGNIPAAQVTGLDALLAGKLDTDGEIAQSQVVGLEDRLDAIETDPIPVARVSGFEPAVQAIIDAQPAPEQDVVQGAHTW